MRKFLFNIHLYTGLLAGLFIVVMGLTGSLMAFEPEIDHLVHHQLFYVDPGNKTLSLAKISQRVSERFPGDTIAGYSPAVLPGFSSQVYLQDKTVFVNPYTGLILGSLRQPDFWERLQDTIHQWHTRLAFTNGEPGKMIVSWACVGLLILQLTGVILWWKQKRFTIRWKRSSRVMWLDLHNSIGIFAYVFLFFLTVTGIFIGFGRQMVPLIFKVTNSNPIAVPDFRVATHAGGAVISPDSALAIARKAIPGTAARYINAPGPGDVYVVMLSFAEDLTPRGRNEVYIDPSTGKVLYTVKSGNAPRAYRVLLANRAIHTGDIFGLPSKIIMSLASLSVVLLFISGVVMWWKRR